MTDYNQVADGLERAADELEGRWGQGFDVDPNIGPICAGIAINNVFGSSFLQNPDLVVAYRILAKVAPLSGAHISAIVMWNDSAANEQIVLDGLRGAAKYARQIADGVHDGDL